MNPRRHNLHIEVKKKKSKSCLEIENHKYYKRTSIVIDQRHYSYN